MRSHGAQRVRTKATTGSLLSELSLDSSTKQQRISVSRVLVHWVLCITSVVFGLRVAQEASLIRGNFSNVEDAIDLFSTTTTVTTTANPTTVRRYVYWNETTVDAGPVNKSTRVYVGRHPILVRPWPHPEPLEMAQAYRMIARVQLEQQRLYGIRSWKPVIAITPMYARTFQSVHLTGLLHTLSLVRGPVTWIVAEAGGASAETAALLKHARVDKLVHLPAASERLPPGSSSLQDRRILESHLRVEGLRYVREHKLEGVVVFADDSNVHNLQLFDTVQMVDWVGALPLGFLGHAGFEEATFAASDSHLPLQAPICDPSSGRITGWHALEEEGLEWAGFAMNARAVWDQRGRPKWIREWDEWATLNDGRYVDVRDMVRDETEVEALGRCGIDGAVLVWWARLEARSDSKFPSRWALDAAPEIIAAAKRTPWPERTFPLSSPTPPATTKRKGGNRSGGGKTRRRRKPQRDSTRGTT